MEHQWSAPSYRKEGKVSQVTSKASGRDDHYSNEWTCTESQQALLLLFYVRSLPSTGKFPIK